MRKLSAKEGNVTDVPYFSSRERERESQIQVGICYHKRVFTTVANTHWVFATVVNTHYWVFATISEYLLPVANTHCEYLLP